MSWVGSTIATRVRASLGVKCRAIASAVALFFAGVLINTAIPAFEGTTSSGKGNAYAEETKPVKSPSKAGGLTPANIDVRRLNWNTMTIQEFKRDYCLVRVPGPNGERVGANGQGYYWYLVRGEEKRARKDGIYVRVNYNDPELMNRKFYAIASAFSAENEFISEEEYKAAFRKVMTEFDKRWYPEGEREAGQLLADQQAAIPPRDLKKWSIFENDLPVVFLDQLDGQGKFIDSSLCTMDEEGRVRVIKDRKSVFYQVRYAIIERLKKEMKGGKILATMPDANEPNIMFLRQERDGVFRNAEIVDKYFEKAVTKAGNDEKKLLDACKSEPRVFVLQVYKKMDADGVERYYFKGGKNGFLQVYQYTQVGFSEVDPAGNADYMKDTQLAREAAKKEREKEMPSPPPQRTIKWGQ